MALSEPLTGPFVCLGINAGGVPGGDVNVSFSSADGSALQGSFSLVMATETAAEFQVGTEYEVSVSPSP